MVKCKTSSEGKTAVKPDILHHGEGAGGSRGNHERRKAGRNDDAGTCHEGPTDVEILVFAGSCTHDAEAAHHCHRVEAGAGQDVSGRNGSQGSNDCRLGGVKGGPERILGDVAVGREFNIYSVIVMEASC